MSRDMNIPYEEANTLAPAAIPMGRIAEPEEVANLVAMMASPLTHYVNGTMIEIDGVDLATAKEAMRLGQAKLSIATKFVARSGL